MGFNKDRARESLLVFGMALLFASIYIVPEDVGAMRFIGIIAIGAASTLTAALAPER